MNEHAKPIPSPTEANRPFWSGCADGKLRLRCCKRCGKHHAPTRAACTCGGVEFDWVEVSGRGKVFSYTVVHRAPDPAFRAELPYVIVIVEFDEGGRLMGNMTGCPPVAVRIGMPVRTVFEIAAEGIGVPKFQPV
jgi:hypothetical protein